MRARPLGQIKSSPRRVFDALRLSDKDLMQKATCTSMASNDVPKIVFGIIKFWQDKVYVTPRQREVIAEFLYQDWKRSTGFEELPTRNVIWRSQRN